MKKISTIAIIIAIFLGIAFYWYYQDHSKKPLQKAAQPVAVTVTTVQEADFPLHIQAVGTLLADQEVHISPEVAGHVAAILFTAGSHVAQGTPLIQLDATIQKAKLKASVADLDLAKVNYQRMQELFKQKALAKEDLDKAKADLEQKEAQVAEDKALLAKMTLRAPFAGTLGARQISVGDYVKVGQSLLELVAKNSLRLSFQLSERYLTKLNLGQNIAMVINGKRLQAKIAFIAPFVDPVSHAVEVRAVVNNKDNFLSPGMFVHLTLILGIEKKALLVPEDSVIPSANGQIVYKVLKSKANAQQVTLGHYVGTKVQILSGLKKGDKVIVAGADRVKNGSLIKVVQN